MKREKKPGLLWGGRGKGGISSTSNKSGMAGECVSRISRFDQEIFQPIKAVSRSVSGHVREQLGFLKHKHGPFQAS